LQTAHGVERATARSGYSRSSEQGTINLTASPNNGGEGYDAVVDVGTSNSSSERKATGTLSSQPPKEMTCNFLRAPSTTVPIDRVAVSVDVERVTLLLHIKPEG